MRPRTFCQQALQVLRLTGQVTSDGGEAALETLLGYFSADDVTPGCFERQLQLLAETDVCPCMSWAAERLLTVWQAERASAHSLRWVAHCN